MLLKGIIKDCPINSVGAGYLPLVCVNSQPLKTTQQIDL
jgi:hypothetical protein